MAPQRHEPRYVLALTIAVVDADTGDELGEVVNISANGLMLASTEALTTNQEYRLRLLPPAEVAEPFEVVAEAAWAICALDPPRWQTGFRDLRVADADRGRLDQLAEGAYRVDPL